MTRQRLFILSHVLPFPGSAGQQKRVHYTLQAARESFDVTFVTAVPRRSQSETGEQLAGLCQHAIVLVSAYDRSVLAHVWHRVAGEAYAWGHGLKLSNYIIGHVDFSPARVGRLLDEALYDCALFEYWHAVDCVAEFRDRGIPCVLDMHNILWRARDQRLRERRGVPGWYKRRLSRKYQTHEEAAWREFDGIITINREEFDYVRGQVPDRVTVFYAPMGTDLTRWPFTWEAALPVRVGYYGGLGSRHNQDAALKCLETVMPAVWRILPDAELWLVGSNPPAHLRALGADPRVKVTGFVPEVQPLLASMSCVLCPWEGTYGFRSRIIEVMALGVPVVASHAAVAGMELEHGQGLLLAADDAALVQHTLRLVTDASFARDQSRLARATIVRLFSYENTYRRLIRELASWLRARRQAP